MVKKSFTEKLSIFLGPVTMGAYTTGVGRGWMSGAPTESTAGVGAAFGLSGRTQDGVVDAGQASFFSTNFGHAVNQGAGIRVLGVL